MIDEMKKSLQRFYVNLRLLKLELTEGLLLHDIDHAIVTMFPHFTIGNYFGQSIT